jgi:hypothetical protein
LRNEEKSRAGLHATAGRSAGTVAEGLLKDHFPFDIIGEVGKAWKVPIVYKPFATTWATTAAGSFLRASAPKHFSWAG